MRYTLYFILLLFTFISVFTIHLKFLPEFKHFLIQSYIVNILMALLALFLLNYGIHKNNKNLASIYLLTIALKLIIYFLFFYPKFRLDGNILKKEFFIFFVPYSLGLIVEIFLLARRFR